MDQERIAIEHEDRIDDFAVKTFKAMGYDTLLSDNMVMAYREIKARKDRLQPGRLSPEGFALAAVIGEMLDGDVCAAPCDDKKSSPIDEEPPVAPARSRSEDVTFDNGEE